VISSSRITAGRIIRGTRQQQHLLLATGERTGILPQAGLEDGKQRVDVGKALVERRLLFQPEPQVVANAQVGKQRVLLRRIGDALAGDAVRWLPGDVLLLQVDMAAFLGQVAHHGLQQGALAHAVLAQQRHGLAGRDVQRQAAQHHRGAIAAGQVLQRQRGRAHAASCGAWALPA
jgi:hypothetical protein